VQGPKLPVENVTWDDCQAFIKKLNELTGETFRLPTEAEWEYAARGGANGDYFKYAGNNQLKKVAWYEVNSGNTSHEVATLAPNELGLYDMSGNVWEWCQDKYGSYSSESQTDPTGARSGSYRVYRGGDWESPSLNCRVSYRNSLTPANRHIGLRLAI
jgi:formylglycine-generating enzyme required for sulfatase activity